MAGSRAISTNKSFVAFYRIHIIAKWICVRRAKQSTNIATPSYPVYITILLVGWLIFFHFSFRVFWTLANSVVVRSPHIVWMKQNFAAWINFQRKGVIAAATVAVLVKRFMALNCIRANATQSHIEINPKVSHFQEEKIAFKWAWECVCACAKYVVFIQIERTIQMFNTFSMCERVYVWFDCRSNMKIIIITIILFHCPLHMHRIQWKRWWQRHQLSNSNVEYMHNGIPTLCLISFILICIPNTSNKSFFYCTYTQFHSFPLNWLPRERWLPLDANIYL